MLQLPTSAFETSGEMVPAPVAGDVGAEGVIAGCGCLGVSGGVSEGAHVRPTVGGCGVLLNRNVGEGWWLGVW